MKEIEEEINRAIEEYDECVIIIVNSIAGFFIFSVVLIGVMWFTK